MIIWIDGTYGVGKTTVAKRLVERLDKDVELLEADYYSNETIKKIVEEADAAHKMPVIGGCLPQNNVRFIREFKRMIDERSNDTNKKLVVDMALTRMECKEILFEGLQTEEKDIVHIILTANEEAIKSRIENDQNRAKDMALEWLKYNIAFLDDSYPDAVRIKTDNRNPEDIVDEIIKIIKLKENSF